MDITLGQASSAIPLISGPTAPASKSGDFAAFFNQTIESLNGMEAKADKLEERFVSHGDVELQDVMIANQESDLSMKLTMQFRNKALDAYREILRMPV